ncbi:Uncharacterized protein BM_BM10066 [Brugia malayi]|uniref:Uncharacterized protein n=1 Tax=Brugia malayi TaxID=6279 RepID=A0A4E9FDL5_BRUMA|nr:Uncharacterized protein BM_BM10066 [Brugia malayi]VIO94294.1 Uncharacterized protein BM_BM10066 [Brugia malayi]
MNPHNTAFAMLMIILHSVDRLVSSSSDLYVKRLIGRKSGGPAVQSDMKH